MSNNNPTAPPQQLNINVNDLTDVSCDECGSSYFRQTNLFKRLSPLVSPTGKEQYFPIPIFRCDDCGHINDHFKPKNLQE